MSLVTNRSVTSGVLRRYGSVAIALHWLVAVFALAQIALGWWMLDLPKTPPGPRADWFNLHT
jgi:cytochrome b561